MRRTVAALMAGVLLGITGSAVAASTYWDGHGNDYVCEGVAAGAICQSGGYTVGVTKSFLYVKKGTAKTAPLFYCRKWTPWSHCTRG